MWLASTLQVTASASIETSCELGNGADPVESPWIMFNDLLCVGDSGLVDDQAVFEARTQTTMQVVDNATVAVETYHATKVIGKLERPAGAVLGGGELMWMEQDLGLVRKCTVNEETGGCTGEATIVLEHYLDLTRKKIERAAHLRREKMANESEVRKATLQQIEEDKQEEIAKQ